MIFISASESAKSEREARLNRGRNLLKYGIQYLDDSLLGIKSGDLILIGAPSGVGKTALCCNIALNNMADGKKVHYIALEAERYEIEARLKYQLVCNLFFNDPGRPKVKLSFDTWYVGSLDDILNQYEEKATEFFSVAYKNLFIFYKNQEFTVHTLIETVLSCADDTDLIIIDHAHYFDFDDDNENMAIKEIAKTARTLSLDQNKPIILVAHLRKRDRNNQDLCAGLDEFHGSSDLTKVATQVITISPGKPVSPTRFETFIRTPKSRTNGSAQRFLARTYFNSEGNCYEKEYSLGWADQKRNAEFEDVTPDACPDWAKHNRGETGRDFNSGIQRQQEFYKAKRIKRDYANVLKDD